MEVVLKFKFVKYVFIHVSSLVDVGDVFKKEYVKSRKKGALSLFENYTKPVLEKILLMGSDKEMTRATQFEFLFYAKSDCVWRRHIAFPFKDIS